MSNDEKHSKVIAGMVGKELKKLRGTMTQADFAQVCGLAQGPISRYEAGAQLPSLTNLIKICVATKGNIDELTAEARAYIRKNDLGKPEPKAVKYDPAKKSPAKKATPKKAAPVKAKPAKKTVSKVEKKAAQKAAALDKPDVAKPKRSHVKKVVAKPVHLDIEAAAIDETINPPAEVAEVIEVANE